MDENTPKSSEAADKLINASDEVKAVRADYKFFHQVICMEKDIERYRKIFPELYEQTTKLIADKISMPQYIDYLDTLEKRQALYSMLLARHLKYIVREALTSETARRFAETYGVYLVFN